MRGERSKSFLSFKGDVDILRLVCGIFTCVGIFVLRGIVLSQNLVAQYLLKLVVHTRDGAMESNLSLPTAPNEIADFHENLYERARLAYNAQLGVTIEKLEPRLDRSCYISTDADAVFNPMAIPFYARAEKPNQTLSLVRPSTLEKDDEQSGQSRYFTMHHIFEFNLSKAYDECVGLEGEELEHER